MNGMVKTRRRNGGGSSKKELLWKWMGRVTSLVWKCFLAGGGAYHGFHWNLPVSYKHNLVLDIDHTAGFTALTEPDDQKLQDYCTQYGQQYVHMLFQDTDPKTNQTINDHYYFFPRPYLWVVGCFQRMGYLNVHFISDATHDYVAQVMTLFQQVGVTPSSPFIARETNPDCNRKKDLEFVKKWLFQHHGVSYTGSFLLVDDKASRQVPGQPFYHIPPITHGHDKEILKLLLYVYFRCVWHDVQVLLSCVLGISSRFCAVKKDF